METTTRTRPTYVGNPHALRRTARWRLAYLKRQQRKASEGDTHASAKLRELGISRATPLDVVEGERGPFRWHIAVI